MTKRIPVQVGEILFRGISQSSAVPAARTPGVQKGGTATRAPAAAQQALLEQQGWLDWMRPLLPPELADHLVRVLPKSAVGLKERELVVFADSPAWCARLRYALLGLEEQVRARDPKVARIRARVLMLAGKGRF